MFFISQKIPVLGQLGNLVPIWAKIANFDISRSTWRIFMKLCSIHSFVLLEDKKYMFEVFPKVPVSILGSFWDKILQFFISGSALRILLRFYFIIIFCLKFTQKYLVGPSKQFGPVLLVHWCKIIISPGFFFIFWKF